MDLDRIAVGIHDVDLLAAGADFDIVAERRAGAAQAGDQRC
jgi:hypothetical protein